MDEKALLDAIRSIVKEENAPLVADLADVKKRVTKIELAQENTTKQLLGSIKDGFAGVQEKFDKLDLIEDKQEDHERRIWALEQTAKRA